MTTHSRGWFRSIDLWVMGPARFHCATLLMLGGDARKYFSTLILSHFSNTSKFNTVTFSIFFSPFSFFICLLYAFHFLSGPYSLCHSQNIDATQSLVFSPHKSSTLSFFKRVTIIPFGSRIMIARQGIMMARMSAFQNQNSAKPFKTFQESVSPSPKALSSGFPLGPAFLLFSPFPPSKHVLRFIRQKWTISCVQLKLLPPPGCYTDSSCSAALDYWRLRNKAPFCQIPLLARFRAN